MNKNVEKKKGKMQSCFAILVILVVVVIAVGFVAYNTYNDAIYSINSDSSEEVTVVVEEGATLNAMAKTLEDKGLIKNSEMLKIYLRLNSISPSIKAGTYSIPKNKSAIQIIDILEKGVLKPGIRITFKEGLRHEEISELLAEKMGTNSLFDAAEFNNIVENPDNFTFSPEVNAFLIANKPTGLRLEGFLYPDTYEFAEDQTTLDIINKMIENFILKVETNINLDNLDLKQGEVTNLYQAMILGSIIEEESGTDADRKEISSVFHNRLADGMPLQSDVTINYATGKNDDYVTIADTQTDSPYNTYINTGLPPTPIDNPRIESIVAALYPNSTNYYFFLYDNGQTYFFQTYEEHVIKSCEVRGC